jgi:hypothetical protein
MATVEQDIVIEIGHRETGNRSGANPSVVAIGNHTATIATAPKDQIGGLSKRLDFPCFPRVDDAVTG